LSGKDIPVSVKTRVGYNRDELETWLPFLLKEEPAVITVHARTRKEMSKVPARWERVARAVAIRNEMKSDTLIFGNGDVRSVADAHRRCEETGADGAMLGRAIFGNPWLFHPSKRLPEHISASETSSLAHRTSEYGSHHDLFLSGPALQEDALSKKQQIEIITLDERFRVMIEHTKLFEELLPFKNFAIMKKHYKAYVNGFPGAHELRSTLMEAKSSEEIERVVNTFLGAHSELHTWSSDTMNV
jgi:tRNA-dihydrouridine synthase